MRRRFLEGTVLFAYDLLLRLAIIVALPAFLLHPRLRGRLRQRFGFFPRDLLTKRPVWFHGSSAGDVAALVPLIERSTRRGLPTLLTTWTATGEAMAVHLLDERTTILRAPFDFAGPVRSFVDRLQPRQLVLECLELWPRLIRCCSSRGIPIAIVNGRLSERSQRRYRRLRSLFEPCFRRLSLVCALDPENAARFINAGVSTERVVVEGSSKHARTRAPAPLVGAPVRSRLVLGSIHRQEQAMLLPSVVRLMALLPQLEVIIAPRYPHEAAAMARSLRAAGVCASLASQQGARQAGEAVPPGSVLLLDNIGRLVEAYQAARVAFVGGSLVRRGGHNIVEAAAGGAFVLTGPYTDNCRVEARRLQEAKVAAVVRDGAEFFERAHEALTADAGRARRSAERSSAAVAALAAAGDRIADRLDALQAPA